jgi:hypothetical protein
MGEKIGGERAAEQTHKVVIPLHGGPALEEP